MSDSVVLVRDIVREVVTEVAPEELPVMNSMFLLDDATAVRLLRRGRGRREPLGFGWGEVLALATPAVWMTLDQIAGRAVGSVADGVVNGSQSLLRKIWQKRSEPATPATVPPLTLQQLAEVREQVCATAQQRGMSEERARVLADAVVSRLIPAVPGADSGPEGTVPA